MFGLASFDSWLSQGTEIIVAVICRHRVIVTNSGMESFNIYWFARLRSVLKFISRYLAYMHYTSRS